MTRQIKFRAWDTKHKRFVEPDKDDYRTDMAVSFHGNVLTQQDNGACGDPECCGDYEEYMAPADPDRFILMQFTNLLDKNGKEIYEGDIVEYPRYRGSVQDGTYKEVIEWEVVPTDMLSPEHRAGFYIPERTSVLEIIGNIYENSDLLTN